ncbi:MAG: AEC family transporter [Alphaproteobacteria bacterium]
MDVFIDISLPVFGIMLAGFLAGRFGLIGSHGAGSLNGYVYYAALPALFFKATATAPLSSLWQVDYILAMTAGYAATGIIGVIIARLFFAKNLGELALNVGNGLFSNTGYMGIPLILIAFGQDAMPLAISGVLINAIGFFAIITGFLEYHKLRQSHHAASFGIFIKLSKALAKNPLLLSAAIGICFSFFEIKLPVGAFRFFDLMSQSAGPCALFAMGLFIAFQKFEGNRKEIITVSMIKLTLHPLLTWYLARSIFNLSPLEEAVAVTLAALPTGALMFLLSDMYKIYQQRSAAIIVLSTLMAVISVSWVLNHYAPIMP